MKKLFGGLYGSFLRLTIIPTLILGLLAAILSYDRFSDVMHQEVKQELRNAAVAVVETYKHTYEGDYRKIGESKVAIVKGDNVLNGDNVIIDTISKKTDTDISIFYGNTRIVSTITENGNRIVGTTVRKLVFNEVVLKNQSHFYTNAMIGNDKYFAFYEPLVNSDGTCIGMVAVCKKTTDVSSKINKVILPIILITIVAIILSGLISFMFYKEIVKVVGHIRSFIKKTSSGDFDVKMNEMVSKRQDELGDIGKSAVVMQKSLRNLTELDELTKITNRRYGNRYLTEISKKSEENGMPYTVAIGDIDFFKKVNDTYGHDCGDEVLKKIAGILKAHMVGFGYASRWGGEEFLLVFSKTDLNNSYKILQGIMQEIRHTTVQYGKDKINVTMTFGISEGNSDVSSHILLKEIDNKLYEGKRKGRNKIIK